MSPDRSPSIQKEIPHSKAPFPVLVGEDVLVAGGFNAGEPSDMRFTNEGRRINIFIGTPEGYDVEQANVIVGGEVIVKGAVWYNRWRAGTIQGLPRGARDDEGARDFDRQVDLIMSGEELPYTQLQKKVISLISEERLREIGMIE